MVTRTSHKVDRSLSSRIKTISMAQEAEVAVIIVTNAEANMVAVVVIKVDDEWRRRTMK